MPVLQLDDQQFPLSAGATRIGSGAGVDVALPGDASLSVLAVIDGGASPTIRRGTDVAHVRVNGVLLGAEPTPLMHGDKLELGGLELRYADDAKSGATQYVSASEIAAMAGVKRSGAARATTASGGRLVSLVDGKEFTVPGGGLVFGRDASCDVVVAQTEVSRRHAEIVADDQGYNLRDLSANGSFVNGVRVQGAQRLARSDVLRIGSEEFRFYADLAPAAAASVPPASPKPVPAAAPPKPPAPAPETLAPVVTAASAPGGAPAAPQAAPKASVPPPPLASPSVAAEARPAPVAHVELRPLLATLESVNEGPMKGNKHELRTPLAHIGRGAHNDVNLSDESVSETHAKLQRRDDGWYVVDMESTNGTYVGGTRIVGERRIEGSPDVRFGGLKFRFAAIGAGSAADVEHKGTRAIARATMPGAKATPKSAPSIPAPAPAPVATSEPVGEPARGSLPIWVWLVAAIVVAGLAFFLLQGRA
jgi:pSer/pThr/pTyr-binding forkhead associated (FHA) protein